MQFNLLLNPLFQFCPPFPKIFTSILAEFKLKELIESAYFSNSLLANLNDAKQQQW